MPPLAGLSTGHKLGLALAATAWIIFSLAVALLVPRYRPQFPGRRGLPLFLIVTFLFFIGMLTAVEVFGAESEEAVEHETSTSEGTAPATTNAGRSTAVPVKEVDYRIELKQRTFRPGSYTFELKNAGKDVHNLTVSGPGVNDAATPTIAGGKTARLTVAFTKGTYELYCSVPGHKQAGMDLRVNVG